MTLINVNEMLLELKLIANSLQRRWIVLQHQIQNIELLIGGHIDEINEALIEESPSLNFRTKM